MNGYSKSTLSLLICLLVFLSSNLVFAQPSNGIYERYAESSYDGFRDLEVAVNGVVYIAAGTSGLLILEPDEQQGYIVYNQYLDGQDRILACERHHNRLLVYGRNYLYMYDITLPLDPTLIEQYAIVNSGFFSEIASFNRVCWDHDDCIYMIYSRELEVYRMNEGGTLQRVFVQTFDYTSYYSMVALRDSVLLLSKTDNEGIWLTGWDVSNPENPVELEEIAVSMPGSDFFISGELLVSAGDEDVAVYNAADPENITLLATYTSQDDVYFSRARVIGDYIYVNESFNSQILAFELIDNTNIVFVDSDDSDLYYNSMESVIYDETVYTPYGNQGLITVPLGDQPFGERSVFDPISEWSRFTLLGDKAIISKYQASPVVYQIGDAGAITSLGTIPAVNTVFLGEEGAGKVLLRGVQSGVGDGPYVQENRILIPDESNPYGVVYGESFVTGSAMFSENFGEWIYALAYGEVNDTLIIVNAADPANPFHEAAYVLPLAYYHELAVYNDYLYCITIEYDSLEFELDVYSLADPRIPELVTTVELGDYYQDMHIHGDLLFIEAVSGAIGVYSLENPASPEIFAACVLGNCNNMLAYENGFLMVSESHDGDMEWERIVIYDCRDGFYSPVQTAYVTVPGAYAVYAGFVNDDQILITWYNGFGLYEWEPMAIEDSQNQTLPDTPQMQAYPNPANPETRITLELPQAEAVMVCVYDVLGREVVRLHEGVLHAGSHAFHFGSQPGLSSGVYFVRATAGKWETAQRIVLLK